MRPLKTFMVFTGTGPILVVTRLNDMEEEVARLHMESKGIRKYIAYEVPYTTAETRYGTRLHKAVDRLASDDDIRVFDVDGHHAFMIFDFTEMGEPVYVDAKLSELLA
ncbi:MAG: hypothetical protein COW73_06215 [Nitrospirae bacterium CG18_big_fil_WC_8_21_14_2_50_70_55]|nr:hypothetical protein [Deltaproteobacteria bacterium]OIP63909.1 MAG: hypothetical protein AUK30_07630 [Nitrospirae bacterium CG2_30_70_394]PIQ05273.1 MAG: hypothetical protein COW73_06215 [Nitrospirae bacterium CG18_big_fil_WC_8_21_14_2_50_70_55]PIU80002.1 MAG: hypothetical protein COS73_01575 [Nitrospirae bacterium CG06_land_8_20_14_3_00_70_43]PIW83714.1 MAG: hypothetical protein COZ96_01950 [Nitrospirae bacterium CG_4_8_14_3_um_filter_70_85]PIX83327.1 MAG: hypothetical protein COZ33_06010 